MRDGFEVVAIGTILVVRGSSRSEKKVWGHKKGEEEEGG